VKLAYSSNRENEIYSIFTVAQYFAYLRLLLIEISKLNLHSSYIEFGNLCN